MFNASDGGQFELKLYNLMFNALKYIRGRGQPGLKIYNLIRFSRMYFFVQKIYRLNKARRNRKNPDKQMLESCAFFDVNKDRVNNITSWLIDDASKDCYIKMIDFRCNSIAANFPASSYLSASSYFYNKYFTYGNDEVFVDCGAYIGDTVTEFKKAMKRLKGGYSKIVAFEPDAINYNVLTQNHMDVIAIKAGAWKKDDTLYFSNLGIGSLYITTDKNEKDCASMIATAGVDKVLVMSSREPMGAAVSVPVRSIDGCPDCRDVTFLKMDIEGSEMEALEGAKETIAEYKPKLAICIYHSDEDMIRIPEWIHDNFPEYKLFVRQHDKYSTAETVLYGFVD